jgi:hypothetical protein
VDSPRRETSSGASSVRPGLFPDFDLGPQGRRSVQGRGFLQKDCLMGWAAGGPSNSGRREYFIYSFIFVSFFLQYPFIIVLFSFHTRDVWICFLPFFPLLLSFLLFFLFCF